jgi:hypothetical protein
MQVQLDLQENNLWHLFENRYRGSQEFTCFETESGNLLRHPLFVKRTKYGKILIDFWKKDDACARKIILKHTRGHWKLHKLKYAVTLFFAIGRIFLCLTCRLLRDTTRTIDLEKIQDSAKTCLFCRLLVRLEETICTVWDVRPSFMMAKKMLPYLKSQPLIEIQAYGQYPSRQDYDIIEIRIDQGASCASSDSVIC